MNRLFFCQQCGQQIQLDPSLLTMEPQPIPETTRGHLSHRLSIANKLFKLISEETDIDNPMCDECSQEFVAALEKKIHDLKKEQALYDQFLKNNPETKVAKNDVELVIYR